MTVTTESPNGDRSTQDSRGKRQNRRSKSNRTNTPHSTSTIQAVDNISTDSASKDMELRLLKTLSPIISETEITPITTVQSVEMVRKDSGWSEGPHQHSSQPSSRRTSTSTSTSRRNSPSRTLRQTHRTTHSSSSSTRPSIRRVSKSSSHAVQLQSRCVFTPTRPSLNARHTIQNPTTPPQQSVSQFYHFPHFPSPESSKSPPPPPPPQPAPTVNYWTSNQTRRLEYAAIDAASQGIRGFMNKLIPECMLSKEFKRTRFCRGDEGSDAGSVRRYRLDMPIEDDEEKLDAKGRDRPSFFKRWSGGVKKATL